MKLSDIDMNEQPEWLVSFMTELEDACLKELRAHWPSYAQIENECFRLDKDYPVISQLYEEEAEIEAPIVLSNEEVEALRRYLHNENMQDMNEMVVCFQLGYRCMTHFMELLKMK